MKEKDLVEMIGGDLGSTDNYLVYSDFLQQSGNPIGKLISLDHKLENDPKNKALKKERATYFKQNIQDIIGISYKDYKIYIEERENDFGFDPDDCEENDYAADMYGDYIREMEEEGEEATDYEDFCRDMYVEDQEPPAAKGLEIQWHLGHVSTLAIRFDHICEKMIENLSLPSFQFLTSLTINCVYVDAISEKIIQLKHLTHLDISGNKLDTVPSNIGQLVNLTHLNIGNNDELTSISAAVSQLPNLTHLDISYTEIKKSSPEIIKLKKNIPKIKIKNKK